MSKDWLRKDSKVKTKARFDVCPNTFELSANGQSTITDHGKGKKHLEELRKVNSFFSPQKKKDESNSTSKSMLWRLLSCHLPQQVNRHWTLVLIYLML